jgi:hypothetical protein
MSDADSDSGKGDGSEEVSRELVVASGDRTQVFEFVEEALDQVALAIAFEIDAAERPGHCFGWVCGAVVPSAANSSMMLVLRHKRMIHRTIFLAQAGGGWALHHLNESEH